MIFDREDLIEHLRVLDKEAADIRKQLGLAKPHEEVGAWGGTVRVEAEGYGGEWLIEYNDDFWRSEKRYELHRRLYVDGVPGDVIQALCNGELEWNKYEELVPIGTRKESEL